MKQITIAGNIGKTAEIREAGQSRVAGWSVAVDDGWGDNKTTLWFDCNFWGKRGESVAPHIQKGGKITVTGELSTREHNGKTYLTVNVNDVTLQSKSEGGQGGGGYQAPQGGGYDAPPQGGDMDDEIPF